MLAASGTVFALTSWPPALVLAAFTGTISPDVVESGPFTSLEQAMLPRTIAGDPTRLFGTYNTIATLAGALAAALPTVISDASADRGGQPSRARVGPVPASGADPRSHHD